MHITFRHTWTLCISRYIYSEHHTYHLYTYAHIHTHLFLHTNVLYTHVYRNTKKNEEILWGGLCSQDIVVLGMTTHCVMVNCGLVFSLFTHNGASAWVEWTPRLLLKLNHLNLPGPLNEPRGDEITAKCMRDFYCSQHAGAALHRKREWPPRLVSGGIIYILLRVAVIKHNVLGRTV